MPNQNLGELFTQAMDKIENTLSDINIHTKTIEGTTIEIENVDINNGSNFVIPQEKDIDITLLREGPATVEIGEYTWEVVFEYNDFQRGYGYFNKEDGFEIVLMSEPKTAIIIIDETHTYNEPQAVRIIYPTATKLYSTQDSLYLGADENGNNGTKVITNNNGRIAIGAGVTASGDNSQAFGQGTAAFGDNSHAEGVYVIASGDNSHAEGQHTQASENSSHAEGSNTVASGDSSHAEGYSTEASDDYSHAEGEGTEASGAASHAEGYHTVASSSYSHAEGYSTEASSLASHAEGEQTTASGARSHAEGYSTTASGDGSHAEGYSTATSNNYSHAEGEGTVASGAVSHAEGYHTTAVGKYSHVSGKLNVSDNKVNIPKWKVDTQYRIGDIVTRLDKYNSAIVYECIVDHTSTEVSSSYTLPSSLWKQNDLLSFAEIVGNGVDINNLSNARALTWSGDERLRGDLYVGCNANSTGGTKVIPLPTPPTTDGTYTLQCTVSNGTATYSWVSTTSILTK